MDHEVLQERMAQTPMNDDQPTSTQRPKPPPPPVLAGALAAAGVGLLLARRRNKPSRKEKLAQRSRAAMKKMDGVPDVLSKAEPKQLAIWGGAVALLLWMFELRHLRRISRSLRSRND